MVAAEQKRELLGVGLLALALFAFLALIPVGILGGRWAEWFPSGNLIGVVGREFQRGAFVFFGVASALLPLLIGLSGLHFGGWMERERVTRLAVLGGGLLLLVPTAFPLIPAGDPAAGWVGHILNPPLTGALGGLGTGLLLGVLFVLLSLATLGWNPLRSPFRWTVVGVESGTRKAGELLVAGWSAWRASRAAAPTRGPGEAPSDEGSPGTGADDGAGNEAGDAGTRGKRSRREKNPAPPIPDGELPEFRDPRELAGEELPPLGLLTAPAYQDRGDMDRDLDALGEVLVEKLRTFNVESEIGGRTTGPVVTQFEVIPAPGVKVNRIANLDADLALAMRAKTIRIVAPIPGKGAVGVEIPNPSAQIVQLREILEAPAFLNARGDLPLALGRDLHGEPYVADLAKMPHALIAGATGSGKSVCLNTVITSLVYRHTPETLRLLLVDPKMVELSTYSDLPHLRHPVVTDPKDAAGVLKWAVIEMERRYTLLKENGVRSIGEFNRRLKKGAVMRRVTPIGGEGDPDRWIYDEGVLPFIVLVVDELADLMMTVQSEVEKPLTLLAQKARAIGIHLIVATQRPSVNVITGLIKANFPCRIAFRVASKTDSRTILDQNGADALLGNGDMLFLPPGQSAPVRVQGAFMSTEDTDRMMEWFRELRDRKMAEGTAAADAARREEDILELVRAMEEDGTGSGQGDAFGGEWDEFFFQAAEVCIQNEQGSTSLLQRKLRVGYGRAARIVDQLHDAGVLGPPDGSKPREVLMGLEQVQRMMAGGE